MSGSMLPGSQLRPQPPSSASPGATRAAAPNKPRGSMAPPISDEPVGSLPDERPPVEAESRGQDAKGSQTNPDVKSAEEVYLENLKEADLTPTQAAAILDAMISHQFYEERVPVMNRTALLRTRNYQDSLRIQAMLERDRPARADVANERIAMYSLASSLIEFGSYRQPHNGKDEKENFELALAAIEKFPHPVVYALQTALVKFDNKITVASSDGSTSVF